MNREVVAKGQYSRFPVMEGDLDRVFGIVHVKDLFLAQDSGQPLDLRQLARPPLLVPGSTRALDVLARLQQAGEQMAVVIDEHGGVQGISTMTDRVELVVGDSMDQHSAGEPRMVRGEDGSWLVDASLPIPDFLRELNLRETPGEESRFTTVGGLILAHLHRLPVAGDQLDVDGWRFEVLQMDGNRIDRVRVTRLGS